MDIPLSLRLGIDNVSDDYGLAVGSVRDAVDVNIHRDGSWSRRAGRSIASAQTVHSLWTSSDGRTFAVRSGSLCRVSLSGTSLSVTTIAALGSNAHATYDEVNGDVIVCERSGLWRVDSGDVVTPLSLPALSAPALVQRASGGLYAGDYGVAVALLRGDEEGPLSSVSTVTVPNGGGIQVDLGLGTFDASVDGVRIYRTGPNGAELRRAADVGMLVPSYVLGVQELGREENTRFLSPMPGGAIVRHWRGRLLVASGRTLRVSRPFAYGLTDERTDFVQFDRSIDIMVAVNGGVWVGTSEGVFFLDGESPAEWKLVKKSARRPVRGSDVFVRADLLGGDPSDQWVAVWLSENGFVVGRPDGQLIEQQAKNIRLPDSETAAGVAAAVVHDRAIIASIN